MKTKLTLSVDPALIGVARSQATAEGTSVSALFSKLIVAHKAQSERNAVASLQSMVGSLKAFPIDDSKPAIRALYANKHSR